MILQGIFLIVLLQCSFVHLQIVEDVMGLNHGKVAYRVRTKMTWADANRYCEAKNARLVTTYLLQHEFLNQHLFGGLPINEPMWAGFMRPTANSEYDWVKAYELEAFSMIKNATTSAVNCGAVAFNGNSSYFVGKNCNELRNFICEAFAEECRDPFSYQPIQYYKQFFIKSDVRVTFNEAYKYCAIFQATLITDMSDIDNKMLIEETQSTTRSIQAFWLGAYRIDNKNDWRWFGKEAYNPSYAKFMPNYVAPTASESNNRLVMWTNQARVLDTSRVHGTWGHQDPTAKHAVMCIKRCTRWGCN